MDEIIDIDVLAVLVIFCALSKTKRKKFMKWFNDYHYGSPQEQQKMAELWLELCYASSDPFANRIAETKASYVVPKPKERKKR